MTSLSKPLLVYDGDCSFCRKWIERWKKITRDRIDYAPYQEVAGEFPNVPREEFEKAVQLFDTDGKRYSAAEAVFRTLALRSFFWKVGLWKYKHIPGFAPVSEWVYRLIARHRKPSSCPV